MSTLIRKKKNSFYIDFQLAKLRFRIAFPYYFSGQSLRTRGKLHPSFEFCDGVPVFRKHYHTDIH